MGNEAAFSARSEQRLHDTVHAELMEFIVSNIGSVDLDQMVNALVEIVMASTWEASSFVGASRAAFIKAVQARLEEMSGAGPRVR